MQEYSRSDRDSRKGGAVSEEKLGAEDAQTFVAFFNLADAYRMSERPQDAIQCLEKIVNRCHRSPATNHPTCKDPRTAR